MLVALDLPARDVPGLQLLDFERLRNIVREEAEEFDIAMENLENALARQKENKPPIGKGKTHQDEVNGHWASVIDAVCDTIVVLHNTTNGMGVDIEPFFEEVHRTNMAKIGGPIREDGKRLKPEGWEPPRIRPMLENLVAAGEAKP